MHAVLVLPFEYGLRVCPEDDSLDSFLILQTPEPFRQDRRGRWLASIAARTLGVIVAYF